MFLLFSSILINVITCRASCLKDYFRNETNTKELANINSELESLLSHDESGKSFEQLSEEDRKDVASMCKKVGNFLGRVTQRAKEMFELDELKQKPVLEWWSNLLRKPIFDSEKGCFPHCCNLPSGAAVTEVLDEELNRFKKQLVYNSRRQRRDHIYELTKVSKPPQATKPQSYDSATPWDSCCSQEWEKTNAVLSKLLKKCKMPDPFEKHEEDDADDMWDRFERVCGIYADKIISIGVDYAQLLNTPAGLCSQTILMMWLPAIWSYVVSTFGIQHFVAQFKTVLNACFPLIGCGCAVDVAGRSCLNHCYDPSIRAVLTCFQFIEGGEDLTEVADTIPCWCDSDKCQKMVDVVALCRAMFR